MLYIPIKQHMDIQPLDLLKSPLGNHYKVISYMNKEVLKVIPLDVEQDPAIEMEFCIIKHSLVEGGWQKGMI